MTPTHTAAPGCRPAGTPSAPRRSRLRLADRITAFAGSMKFVYLHALVFGLWMLVVEEESVADADTGGVPSRRSS